MNPRAELVVVSDVDGCLLDARTYSHAEAAPAVAALERHAVPLVLCTSKTRAEVERLQHDIGITAPFVVENGGALYVPPGAFPFAIPTAHEVAGYQVVAFGRPHAAVLRTLLDTAARVGVAVVTFDGMSTEEVADECGLTLAQARLAKLREYDEPFRLAAPTSGAARTRLWRALREAGLHCSSGGRFEHVTGGTDKSVPLAVLRRLYSSIYRTVEIVGIGDGLNDLELLDAVDIPVVVRNEGGASDLLLRELRGARLTTLEGPAGWREAIERVLADRAAARRATERR